MMLGQKKIRNVKKLINAFEFGNRNWKFNYNYTDAYSLNLYLT